MQSKFIPEDILDNIRHNFDITDLVSQYVKLKKKGRNYFGLCPFHSEKTPSFSVSPDKQIYYCFGCGEGGDVIRFIMNIEGFDFIEAVSYLAKESGIVFPEMDKYFTPEPKDQQRESMLEAYNLASKLYHYILLETKQGEGAVQYLTKRGFSREDIEIFNIGYSPNSTETLNNFLTKRGFSLDLQEQAGLISKSENGRVYDRFRDRIIFPIADIQSRVIAFGGRILENGQSKYLNSPETKIFNKGNMLYNLNLAKKEIRKTGRAILFEGYIDTIAAWKAGINYGVASLGTSLTEQQALILKRYAEEVYISYDSDNAGQQATLRAIDVLTKVGSKVKIVQLPKGYDPDDYISEFGGESFKSDIIEQALTTTSFKLNYIKKDYNLKDGTAKLEYLNNALEIISDLNHAVEHEHYLKTLADEFQVSLDSLKSDFHQIYKVKRNKKIFGRDKLTTVRSNIINDGKEYGKQKILYPAYYNAERNLIYLMMRNTEITKRVYDEIGNAFHVDDFVVLASYLYSYFNKGYKPEINKFISYIEDEKYSKLATRIAMSDINEDITTKELNDYIKQVKGHVIDLELKRKRTEQIKAERNNDIAKSLEIGQEIINLRNRKGKIRD